ncbi:STAS domain-containing protein [Thalassotalea euphylliae]|uniref:STAS domain-containing protein n=1 Tax=Thalassotalea euphylliae TaxID=1655234 RepID=UPI003626BBAA
MEINTHEQSGATVIELTGEVDLHNAKTLKAELLKAAGQKKPVAVNLEKLTYIDSSGMATLVEGFNTAKQNKTKLALIAVNGAPLQVLKLTRLDSIFPMFGSVEAFLND